ncbi:M23 family metallopeptidase [Agromyces sp. NPDC057679]|uniref:M23 family metallopeptidase n=1 Tax=Agromyces sp. NPDC057679 TaxID=3346207 RepID=UPI00366B1548
MEQALPEAKPRQGLSRRGFVGVSATAFIAAVAGEAWFAQAASAVPYVQYQYPFPIAWYDASDPFGNTDPPWRSPKRPHRGADFNGGSSGTAGTGIPAVASGTVVYNDWWDGLGWVLSLRHRDGAFSGYCHQRVQSPMAWGSTVSRGQIIGEVGGTRTHSESYDPHLHLTMGWDIGGTRGGDTRFDPIPYIANRLAAEPEPSEPEPERRKKDDQMFLLYANDATATPKERWAVVGPGFWFVVATKDVADVLSLQAGYQATVTWAEWDRAFRAAVSSGFVPASGQTSRTL